MNANALPRVWVGCLACYNEGALIGAWFDADDIPTDSEDFTNRVSTPPDHTPEFHEELWVMDHEGWDGLIRGECSPYEAAQIWERVKDMDADTREAYGAFVANDPVDATVERFQDEYCGRWDSLKDYAEDLYADQVKEMGGDDNYLLQFIDWERIAHDMDCEGYWTANASDYRGVYIFRP